MSRRTNAGIEAILQDIPVSTAAMLCGFDVRHLRRLTRDGCFTQKPNGR